MGVREEEVSRINPGWKIARLVQLHLQAVLLLHVDKGVLLKSLRFPSIREKNQTGQLCQIHLQRNPSSHQEWILPLFMIWVLL